MSEQIVYREVDYTFNANEAKTYNQLGDTLTILEITGSLEMKLGRNPRTPIRAGITMDTQILRDFKSVQFFETAGSSASITFAVGNGGITDNRLTISSELDISKSSIADTIDDVTLVAATATEIAAADTTRREIIITNMTGDFIRVGDSGVGASSGVRVADGASITLATTAAIHGYSTPGGDVSVTVLED